MSAKTLIWVLVLWWWVLSSSNAQEEYCVGGYDLTDVAVAYYDAMEAEDEIAMAMVIDTFYAIMGGTAVHIDTATINDHMLTVALTGRGYYSLYIDDEDNYPICYMLFTYNPLEGGV